MFELVTIMELSGISFVITKFCPIITLLPMLTPPMIFVPAPINTLFPIFAHALLSAPFHPINTPGYNVQFFPILTFPFNIILPQCQIVIPLSHVFGGIWNPLVFERF